MGRLAAALACVGLAATAGADQAVLRLPASLAARLGETSRWGTVVGVEEGVGSAVVTLTQTLRPLGHVPTWPLPDPAGCGDPEAVAVDPRVDGAMPAALQARPGESALAVVEAVVRYVSNAVTADERDTGAQDAVSVLQRRRGRCSGRANAAVGLLRRLGLPARVVHGVLLAEGGARLHRWGEVWLGEVGWVPFDPGVAVGAVSVRYLPAALAEAEVAALTVESVNEEGFASLPVRGGLRVVPAVGVTLHFRAAEPGERLFAVLTAPDGSRWARLGVGGVRFDALIPGAYRLQWVPRDGRGRAATLRLTETREISVTLANSGG